MKQPINKYLLLSLLLYSCAQQSVPTGGEKDSDPPKLLQSDPVNRQKNFKGNEITLLFNEFVQLNNPREQIIITPEIDSKKLEITARKKRVILRFNQSLKDSTTYTINFREAIQDITEKNPATNLRLAFSTGPQIDTLSIKGNVTQLFSGEPEPNCLVALAPASDTFDIFRHKPEYFTLTDKQGNYTLENLKSRPYLIYAFQDKNKNLIVDSKSEMFGFRSEPILPEKESNLVNISLIKLDMRPLKLASARTLGNHYIIRINKGLYQKKIIAQDTSLIIYHDEPENGIIRIYQGLYKVDSLAVQCHLSDSAGNTIDTLLYAKFSVRTIQPEKFTVNAEKIIYQNMIVNGQLTFNKPVMKVNTDSIYITTDSLTTLKLKPENCVMSANKSECKINVQLSKPLNLELKNKAAITAVPRTERLKNPVNQTKSPRPVNHIIFGKGAFISADGDTSNAFSQQIVELKAEEKAILLYEIQTNHSVIVELYQKDKTMMRSHSEKGRFTNINPGEYRLRVLIDTNNNKKWDWGNYYLKNEPEPVIHYEDRGNKNIPLKANWEVGPLLITPDKMWKNN